MNHLIAEIALAIAPAVLAITLHEAAHGYAALACGDDTARQLGRLSLNPLRHVDRMGTIILPGLLLAVQLLTLGRVAVMFGWAKPVPVNPLRFRYPRQMMAAVAAAGPLMNFFLAWIGALLLHGIIHLPAGIQGAGLEMTRYFIVTNVVLALFNLLPVPPLDGGRIVVGVLPLPLARFWARLERGGIGLVLAVIFVLPFLLRQVGVQFDPVRSVLGHLVPVTMHLVFRLAGHAG